MKRVLDEIYDNLILKLRINEIRHCRKIVEKCLKIKEPCADVKYNKALIKKQLVKQISNQFDSIYFLSIKLLN